jgi:hypothetical protein
MESMRYALILSLFACPVIGGCSGQPEPTTARATLAKPISSEDTGKSKAAVMTRYEFSLAVMGKTPDEVITAVGKPDRTSESEGRVVWYYTNRSTHPLTGQTDSSTQVWFKGGVVVDVVF